MAFGGPPQPKSLLGRHRLLSPTASVRVSPISLGGMSLGTNWGPIMGECTKETAFEMLDTFYELGGNFIDTADVYQGGQSEEWIGEWMEKHGKRSEMVVATKYSLHSYNGQPEQTSNFGGTGTKSMHMAIEASLKKLRTDYVDIYFVHAWDYATQIEELMQSLNNLVRQGKVLYLGISDAPAWVVVKANAYARQHGLRPFSIYQGKFSAVQRDLEREIIPMTRDEGMAIHAFSVLAGGQVRSPEGEKGTRNPPPMLLTGREEKVSAALDVVAKRRAVSVTAVALAYASQKTPYLFPLIGGRKPQHLRANVEALGLELAPEDVTDIEKAYDFEIGYPYDLINSEKFAPQGPQHVSHIGRLGHFDYVSQPAAIKPFRA